MKLYEYAVIYNPIQTKEQREAGERPRSELLVPITTILCHDDKEANMIAARSIPQEFVDKLDRVDIAVRPF